MSIEQVSSEEVAGEDLIHTSEEPHTVMSPVTNEELAKYAKELATIEVDGIPSIDSEIDELKDSIKTAQARLKKIESRRREVAQEVAQIVRTGEQTKSVMCTLELNHSKGTATLTRNDTGDRIQERPLSDEERRMELTPELPFEDDGDTDGQEEQEEYELEE